MVEGTTIGAYRVVHKIGEGGMGVVYLAEHTLLGRKAAIKVLLPQLSAHQEIVQRFFNEARAVTQISDPGIVQVFDFGYHSDGSAYIVMELLEGEALDKRLERIGRMSPLDTLRLMRLVSTSLAGAHGKGIVHRDLKPENIYIVGDPAVTGGERAKILDFGIAKLSSDDPNVLKTRTGMVMGTPVYMSPEQCRGAGNIDQRSDIYSLGCVMMAMLTGRPPFEGEGSGELIAAHLREPPPRASSRLPGLPEYMDNLLFRCLAKSPDERFQTMAQLAETLAVAEQMIVRAGAPTIAAELPAYVASGLTPPPSMRTGPTTLTGAAGQTTPAGSKRTGLVITLVVAVLAIAGGGIYVATRDHATPAAAVHADAAAIAVPVAIDAAAAAVVTAPVDAAPVAPPDATEVVTAPLDAAAPPPVKHPHHSPHPTQGVSDHGQPKGSDTSRPMDRGD